MRDAGAAHPGGLDPEGDFYAFEKGVKETRGSGGKGFVDVWRKGRFAFKYEGKHKDLAAAYSLSLPNFKRPASASSG